MKIDKNSTIISIENTGTTSPDNPATVMGSLSDPYNVTIAAIKAGTVPTTHVYSDGYHLRCCFLIMRHVKKASPITSQTMQGE